MDSWNQGPFIPWNERQAYSRYLPSTDFYDRPPPKSRDRLSIYPKDPWSYRDRRPTNRRNQWPLDHWDRRPINHRNQWRPDHWDEQHCWNPRPPEHWGERPSRIRRSSVSYEPWFEPAPYSATVSVTTQPSSNDAPSISSPGTKRAHVDSAQKHYTKSSSGNSGNVITVSVNSDTTQPSSNDAPSISGPGTKRAPVDSAQKHYTKSSAGNSGSVVTVSVNSDTTQPSSNDASISGPDPKRAARKRAKKAAKKRAKKAATEKALKEALLLVNGMNGNGSLLEQVENNDTSLEDVQYLYSVDPNEGMLVELVDLSENSQISENEDLLASESSNSYIPVNSNSAASAKDSTCDDPTNTLINDDTEKRDVENTPKEHCVSGNAYCNVCNKSFKELLNNWCDLYSARCGHLFCVLCIKRLKIKSKCIQCKKAMSSLRKISL